LVLTLVIFAILYFNQYAAVQNLKKISEVELRSAKFEEENKQLHIKIDDLQTKIGQIESVVGQKEVEIDALKLSIVEEISKRDDQQLNIRMIDNDSALLDEFKKSYPEFSNANNFGVIQVFDDSNQVNIPYLSIPLYFADTFIIEHSQLESYKITEAKYGEVVSIYEEVTKLQDQISLLEKQKAEAWSEGYNNGYKLYTDTQEELITCYKQPRIKIPSWLGMGVTAAGGLAAGIYLSK
jgi:hypothetical protein